MATPTMDNIKKKMMAMKNEKENAMDLADQAEEKTAQLAEKLRLVIIQLFINIIIKIIFNYLNLNQQLEENEGLEIRLQTLDKELEKTTAELERTNVNLEEAAKQASDVINLS